MDLISRQAAIDALDNIKIPCNASWYPYYQQALTAVSKLPSVQPEPEIYWGYTPTYERPLADDEIVPRLRDINAQLGGSYAIDRAIEIIEAVEERRTDG